MPRRRQLEAVQRLLAACLGLTFAAMAIALASDLAERFLAELRSTNTRASRRSALRDFERWCMHNGVSPERATQSQVQLYLAAAQDRGLSTNTVSIRHFALIAYFQWLVEQGFMNHNPANAIPRLRGQPRHREPLSLNDVRLLFAQAIDPRDRSLLALMAIHCLRTTEIQRARVSDLKTSDGYRILRLPERSRTRELPFTVLPPVSSEAIDAHLAGRRTGPLILNRSGLVENRTTIGRMLRRLARECGLRSTVSASAVTSSMRFIAVEHGFSFASVVRAVPEVDIQLLVRRVADVPYAKEQHAAFRMANLLTLDDASNEAILEQSSRLLRESDVQPSASITLSAGVLERHLRQACLAHSLVPADASLDLTQYGSRLKSSGRLDNSVVQTLATITAHRNNAAHGWFDKVTTQGAGWVLMEVRRLLQVPVD